MGAGKRAGTALGVALACALAAAGCGGKGGGTDARPAVPDPAAAAEAQVRTLARTSGSDARTACRTLTLATRRAIGTLGDAGDSCSDRLTPFLAGIGLDPALGRATRFDATPAGARADVRVEGLADPLTAVRTGGQWRVSLIQVPGVRGDVAAAQACGAYRRGADAFGLASTDRAGVQARLARQTRLLSALRRSLRAVPLAGPPRPGLLSLTRGLRLLQTRVVRARARLVAGGDLYPAVLVGAQADRAVRDVLKDQGEAARIHCPEDPFQDDDLLVVATDLAPRCRAAGRRLDAIRPEVPRTLAQLQSRLATTESVLRDFARDVARGGQRDAGVRRLVLRDLPAPVGRTLRDGSRQLRALADVMARLRAATSAQAYDAAFAPLDGLAGRADADLVALGVECATPSQAARQQLPARED